MAQLTDREYVATLLPVDSFEERDAVLSREALDEAYQSLLCEQIDRVEQMLELVAVEARWHASLFYRLVRTRDRDDPDESDFCYIGTRVVFKDGTLSIQWLRNRYVKQGEGKPSKVYSTYIKKGAGFSYSMSLFKREPLWVRELVEATEEDYTVLRERAASLTKLRTELRKMQRRIG